VKYIYIVNRFQLKDKTADIINKIKDASDRYGRDYEIRINDTPEDAAGIRDDYMDTEYVLTAVGGDGSVNHLLNSIIGTGNILSCIPYGAGNDFARTIRREYKSGVHDTDVIRINDRYCINVACFGIDADIANDEHFIHNSFIPRPLRFHAGVLNHFLSYRDGRLLKIECGEMIAEKKCTSIVVANSQFYGGGYRVSPNSRLDDGVMEVLIVDHMSRPEMAKVILSMKKAGHLKHPAVTVLETDRAVVSSPHPVNANIDGEPLCSDRFEIELIPKGIRLEYDKAFLSELFKL
jgi:diacylglycerol kinase family enzyme